MKIITLQNIIDILKAYIIEIKKKREQMSNMKQIKNDHSFFFIYCSPSSFSGNFVIQL